MDIPSIAEKRLTDQELQDLRRELERLLQVARAEVTRLENLAERVEVEIIHRAAGD